MQDPNRHSHGFPPTSIPESPGPIGHSDWRKYVNFNGSEYYARHVEIRLPKDARNFTVLVVDDVHLRSTADNMVTSSSFFSEEIHVLDDKRLFVSHSSQTAVHSSQETIGNGRKQKQYWSYIAQHPAHVAHSMAKRLPEAYAQAMLFLQYCSFEALTSSTTRIPFPLKNSQNLAQILSSLHRQAESNTDVTPSQYPHVPSGELALPAMSQQLEASGSSQPPLVQEDFESQAPGTVVEVPVVETVFEQRSKLYTTIIARVLTERYAQQDAVDNANETDQALGNSRVLEVLFWIVDVASLGSFLRYLRRLDEVRTTMLTDDQWRDHILRLVKEWEEFNLISTVLLSASAGILALDNIGGVPRTAILISILASFGSVTTGLYCISMYQLRAPNQRDSPERTHSSIIFHYNHYTLTHKGIALVLGLPMAFLVWSLISFMVGIVSFNIVGTEISGHISGTAYAVVAVAGAIFFLIALAFYSLSRLWGSGANIFKAAQVFGLHMVQHWRSPHKTQSESMA
ncbi:hypothetical protein C8R46DRAFT_1189255 [Mycena filopes]|nr:hypothetical protein C8R46DRAFT_1189255 [Mycena filopes]